MAEKKNDIVLSEIDEDPELKGLEDKFQHISAEMLKVSLGMLDGEISRTDGEEIIAKLKKRNRELRQGPVYQRWMRVYQGLFERRASMEERE